MKKLGIRRRACIWRKASKIAKALEAYGADAINVSAGNSDTQFIINEPISFKPGWRSYMAKAVKDAVHIPVISVGVIRTPEWSSF